MFSNHSKVGVCALNSKNTKEQVEHDIKLQKPTKNDTYLSPIVAERLMSCPQIIAWYPRRDVMRDVNVDIMTKGLNPVQKKESIKNRIQCTGSRLQRK